MDKKIKLFEGRAENILMNMDEKFDMVFIDAEKNHYLDFLNLVEDKLKEGGLMVADNTLLSGAVYSEELPYRIRKTTRENMVEFNKRLANENKYTSILLPVDDGITIAIKK